MDFFATGVTACKSSKLTLCEDLAASAGCTRPYPLTEACITVVAAALKAAGYKSAMFYVGELRFRHIGHDFPVGLTLGRVFAKVRASLDGVKGPPSRAPEILFSELVWETNEAQEARRWWWALLVLSLWRVLGC